MAMINNDKEALTHALILGITAPSDEALEKVMSIAQEISDRLSDEEIEQCKKEAIAWIDMQEMKKRDEEQSTIH
jgi:mannitol/fructose-specific phosphotransferase system IIA component